ncbi:hypothetical protein HDV00_005994 [Rhizophlyctis rosea]|nr:hypothetical protein HDV00_005994 [Rhizophlyctis rosea]
MSTCTTNFTTGQTSCTAPFSTQCLPNTNLFQYTGPYDCAAITTSHPAYLGFQYMSIAKSDLFMAEFPFDYLKNGEVMQFFWMIYQISFIIPVAIRANSLFGAPKEQFIRYGFNILVALDILYTIAVECVVLRTNTIALMDLMAFVNDLIVPLSNANIVVEVVTDMVLSIAFLYKLGEGMSSSRGDFFTLFTNPKVVRLLFGWFLGITFAATSELYLTFSFEEVRSIVRRGSTRLSSIRAPSEMGSQIASGLGGKRKSVVSAGVHTTLGRKATMPMKDDGDQDGDGNC